MPKKFEVPKINKLLFTTILSIRISDINYGNHLGHDALVSLLHEARLEFLKSLGHTELVAPDLVILVTTLLVNYKGQGFYGDELLIELGTSELYNTSFELIYDVYTKDKTRKIANALTILTFYDIAKAKTVSIPNEFLIKLGSSN